MKGVLRALIVGLALCVAAGAAIAQEKKGVTTTSITSLSYWPVTISWDANMVNALGADSVSVSSTPNNRTIYTSNESAHLKYIIGRVDAPTAAASSVLVYAITAGQTPCSAGTLMMAAGKFFDVSQPAGTVENIPLASTLAVPANTSLCVAATGEFSASAATLTVGIGP